MKIVRITLQKSGYKSQVEDLNTLIQTMEADVEKSGFIVTEVEAVLNTNVSQYRVEVKAERHGRTNQPFGQALWGQGSQGRVTTIILPGEVECSMPLP